MTAIENRIPDVSNFLKKKKEKAGYEAKVLDAESKYFTAADNNKFTSQTLDAKIKQIGLADKSGIAGFMITSYIRGKSHFRADGTQNY